MGDHPGGAEVYCWQIDGSRNPAEQLALFALREEEVLDGP
jgi:hypothetical protein